MFPSRKTNTNTVAIGAIKDWRDAGHEIEVLGARLDYAREAAKEAQGKWAQDFWNTTVARLFTKWELMVQLKDTGLRQKGPNTFYSKIDYDWWEKSEEVRMIGFTWFDGLYENAGLSSRLDESWTKARDEKLQKARQGQA